MAYATMVRLERILTMVYVVQKSQNFFWTLPIVLYSKKHDVSETGSVSVLR
jgi:hypothetical protein